jgi:hypothetical protein
MCGHIIVIDAAIGAIQSARKDHEEKKKLIVILLNKGLREY